ncbi:MAG: alpha/beta fold hydrolase [Anaerolineales bacterium]|nr:alpha/beta fold hydrolase [Anaerolineales bacterium]
MRANIHQDQPVLTYGASRREADLTVILLHGRGASAESMIPLAEELAVNGVHFIVPQAAQYRWYPQSAFGPIEANEPDLSSALMKIETIIASLREDGVSEERIVLGGFSQGACLSSEYVARNARKYGGLFVLSGALIGPPGTPRDYPGSLDGTPVFIGGSDVDPWIPDDLQSETAEVLEKMGGDVEFQIYDGMPHTVNENEIVRVRALIETASGN